MQNNPQYLADSEPGGRIIGADPTLPAKVGCEFKITSTYVNHTERTTDRRVKITTKKSNYMHSEKCCPSAVSQVLAKRKCGHYSKQSNPEKRRSLVGIIDDTNSSKPGTNAMAAAASEGSNQQTLTDTAAVFEFSS